jgi:transposase
MYVRVKVRNDEVHGRYEWKKISRHFTFEKVSTMFGGTQRAAAKHFGISNTCMKRICSSLGIKPWPFKKVKNVQSARRTLVESTLQEYTTEDISRLFGGTQQAAAEHFNVSLSTMQRICRGLGMRWPKGCKQHAKQREGAVPRLPHLPHLRAFAFAKVAAKSVVRRTKKDGQVVSVEFTAEKISSMFGGTQLAAARHFGVGLTTMKDICRRLGMRWPKSRKGCGKTADEARHSRDALSFLNLDGL